jgi:hypothetical protein
MKITGNKEQVAALMARVVTGGVSAIWYVENESGAVVEFAIISAGSPPVWHFAVSGAWAVSDIVSAVAAFSSGFTAAYAYRVNQIE